MQFIDTWSFSEAFIKHRTKKVDAFFVTCAKTFLFRKKGKRYETLWFNRRETLSQFFKGNS